MQKQYNSKINIFIIIFFVIIILFGIILGFFYSFLPKHHPEKNKLFCENAGGQWTNNQTCLLSYKKTGEICTDGGQCISGVCSPPILTEEEKNNLNKGSLKNIVGTCYSEDLVTGCIKQVLKGIITKESMCIID